MLNRLSLLLLLCLAGTFAWAAAPTITTIAPPSGLVGTAMQTIAAPLPGNKNDKDIDFGRYSIELDLFAQRCLFLRDAEKALRDARKVDDKQVQGTARTYRKEITQRWLSNSQVGEDFYAYYIGRLSIIVGDTSKGMEHLKYAAKSSAMAPESLYALYEIAYKNNAKEEELRYIKLLGDVLPVSAFGRLRDAFGTETDVDTDRAVIPIIVPEKLREIADGFSKLNLTEQELVATVEYIYNGFSHSTMAVIDAPEKDTTWLSQESGVYWLRAAKSAWYMRDPDRALNYLAKVIVYGKNSDKDEALAFISKIVGWEKLPEPITMIDGDRAAFLGILQSYAELHMHPRIFFLLQRYPTILDGTGVADQIRTKYMGEWLALVDQYCNWIPTVAMLFGQNVKPKENRAGCTIPSPCNEAALKNVAVNLTK